MEKWVNKKTFTLLAICIALFVFLIGITSQTKQIRLLQLMNRYGEVDEIRVEAGGKTRLTLKGDEILRVKESLRPQAILKGYSGLLDGASSPTGIEFCFYTGGELLFTEEILYVSTELPGCFSLGGAFYVAKVDGAFRELRLSDAEAVETLFSTAYAARQAAG